MPEREAYEIACRFVRIRYFDLVPLAGGVVGDSLAVITADAPRSPGTWNIPDVTGARAVRLPMSGLSFTEVHAFEVKRGSELALPAAYEAAAQTRRAHFGSVICHTGEARVSPERIEEVRRACEEMGMGFFLLWGQDATGNFETVRLPDRQHPPADAVEALLESLLGQHRDEIVSWHRRA